MLAHVRDGWDARAGKPEQVQMHNVSSPPAAHTYLTLSVSVERNSRIAKTVRVFLYMGSRDNACLKVILEKEHSPVGENKMVKNGTDDRWWVENVKMNFQWHDHTMILVCMG